MAPSGPRRPASVPVMASTTATPTRRRTRTRVGWLVGLAVALAVVAALVVPAALASRGPDYVCTPPQGEDGFQECTEVPSG